MIVVFDTNVWISGLQFAKRFGTPTQALAKAMHHDTIASELEDEIQRVLVTKFRWSPVHVKGALAAILVRSVRVRLMGTVAICRDPNDDMFLECALRANADLLIAGDKDLLSIRQYRGTRIVTPASYLGIEPA